MSSNPVRNFREYAQLRHPGESAPLEQEKNGGTAVATEAIPGGFRESGKDPNLPIRTTCPSSFHAIGSREEPSRAQKVHTGERLLSTLRATLIIPTRTAALTASRVSRQEEPGGRQDDFLRAEHYRRQLETVATNATLALFIMDEHQHCTYMNPAAEQLTGYTLAEVQHKALHDLIHHTRPDGTPYPLSECPIDQAFPQNMREQGEEIFVHKDGHFYPVAFTASPILEDGHPVGTIIEAREISEELRARREAALAVAVGDALTHGGSLREILQRCTEAVVEQLDAAFARIWTLNEAEQVLELQASAGMYTHLDGPHGRVSVGKFKIGLIAQERTPHLTNDVPHDPRVGDREWARREGMIAFAGYPLLVEGRTVGVLAMFARRALHDRTLDSLGAISDGIALAIDRHRAETERTRLLRELEVERARLATVFREAPAFITTLRGPDHVFEMSNPPYDQLVGHRDILGKPVREALPEVVEQGFIDLLDQVYRSGEPFVGTEVPVLLQREPGSGLQERFVNFVYQPLPDAEGQISGILVHGVDVTDFVESRRRAEDQATELEAKAEELSRLARRLEVSNRDLDQFAYAASHDLKAPLRGIANLATWIEEDFGERVTDESREHLELLRGRVRRMEGLIDGILQYSRAGRVREAPKAVDVGVLLHEVVDLLALPDGVQVRVPEELPRLVTERLPLQQVFMNLIGNAAKYNRSPDPWVEVTATDRGDGYEFSVADNGPGIAPQYHERIFGIFQTLQGRDEVEGTGIGLSLVRRLVESRGGRVWVKSEEGKGATFRFLWPKEAHDVPGE